MSGSYGWAAKLGTGAAAAVDEALEFTRDSMRCYEEIIDLSGISGSRSHKSEPNQVIRKYVNGEIACFPNPVELARLLPRILGAAAAGTTFSLAETLPEFYVSSDRTNFVHIWNNCRCGRATFSARDGGGLELVMFNVGKTETKNAAGTFPAISISDTTQSFILPQLALTLGGNAYQCDGITVTIDNALNVRFANSLTATEINPTDRMITISTRIPWGDSSALYVDGAANLAMLATFTNGATSLQMSFPAVKFPKSTPTVDDRGEMWINIEARALKTGSTPEAVFTLDSTP
jgi:hypothetical protein